MAIEVPFQTKTCSRCKRALPLSEFGTFLERRIGKARGVNAKAHPNGGKRYPNSRCRPCARAATSEYNKKNRATITSQRRELLYKLRDKVYAHYGNKCQCCGEPEKSFLTLDHMNNDGNLHRIKFNKSQWAIYNDIIERGFPDDIQIACYNCNCGRTRNNGVCPHANSSALSL